MKGTLFWVFVVYAGRPLLVRVLYTEEDGGDDPAGGISLV
jgi:hypothetical protein